MLRHNVGGIDRVARLALGGMFLLAGLLLLTSRIRTGIALAFVGALVLLTGIIRFCVLYVPFGISTAPGKTPRNRVCDCGVWVKAMHDNHLVAPPKEESVEVTTNWQPINARDTSTVPSFRALE